VKKRILITIMPLLLAVVMTFPIATIALAAPPSWTNDGSLNTARTFHTATLLPNGKVLVVGGGGNESLLKSAELYNPKGKGAWSTTGSMFMDRYDHTATLLSNGKVLVAGGYSGISGVLSSAELYDPTTGNWTYTGSMNTARLAHTMTLLQDGRVLVAGGADETSLLSSAEFYNPGSGLWSGAGSMSVPRVAHTATLLPLSGAVLFAGGISATGPDVDESSAEVWDPDFGWLPAGIMNAARHSHTATLLPNGKVLVTGGESGSSVLSAAELYDEVTNNWTNINSMTNPRMNHTAILLLNGRVLVAGGETHSDILSSSELYKPTKH
jgi:hypothetical protein